MIVENPLKIPPYTVDSTLAVKARIPDKHQKKQTIVRDLRKPAERASHADAEKQAHPQEDRAESRMAELTSMLQNITGIEDLIRAADKVFSSGNLRADEKVILVGTIDTRLVQITQEVLAGVKKKLPQITTIEQLAAVTADFTKIPKGLSPREAMFNRLYTNMKSNLMYYRESLQETATSDI